MDLDPQNFRTRRDFIRQAACAAVGTVAITNAVRDLRLVSSALAQTTLTDYKALVCIFLSGGNDSNNVIIPTSTAEYDSYSAIRQNLALLKDSLLPISPINSDGRTYGFHPRFAELNTLFGEGKLAVVFNTGPLLAPTTRAQYRARSVALPPQLFSHSDQVTHWQTSLPDQPPRTGWGGRVADVLHPLQYDLLNSDPTWQNARISLCTSIAGANTFEIGSSVQQYHVSTTGAIPLSGTSVSGRLGAIQGILADPIPNLQRGAYADVVGRAINTAATLNDAVVTTALPTYWNTPFPTTNLGRQLMMVARLIQARGPLAMKRQIFFTSVGGYDTHTSQVGTGALPDDRTVGSHANLLTEISKAMYAFQKAMEQIGTSNAVTSFTASDFGRTFPTNGQGSDHGWGSHHIVMGGAVRGRYTYGNFPALQVNGPDDTSTGRWIPTVSVDEYSATLAKWFGVNSTYMGTVFPNLRRFVNPDLGFMR